ncbi:hypothetical protein GGR58DRAFT_473005, partial [Xylaria digitata]
MGNLKTVVPDRYIYLLFLVSGLIHYVSIFLILKLQGQGFHYSTSPFPRLQDGLPGSSPKSSFHPFLFAFQIFQWLTNIVFAPTPPPPNAHLGRPKIAIIGAGITGVSAAAYWIGHGFDVTIFESGSEKSLGGIWSVS